MKILCVHQGAEMYGSDRSFFLSVRALRSSYPEAKITCLLPQWGPLCDLLKDVCNELVISPIDKLQKKDIKSFLVYRFLCAVRKLSARKRLFSEFDLVYVNTVVVLDFILALGFWSGPKIIHVREIPTGLGAVLFSALLRFSKATIFFNSQQTSFAFRLRKGQKSIVIHNGAVGYADVVVPAPSDRYVNLLLVGRINSWKGHRLLLDAVYGLPKELRGRVRLRFVGGCPEGHEHFLEELEKRCKELSGDLLIDICPFVNDPSVHYAWADIVVVPSTKPEPFGLVAIEAMSAGKPVIAAGHGGLVEIVQNGVTGLLFEPGSETSLRECLVRLIDSPRERSQLGSAGKNRFESVFSVAAYESRFVSAVSLELFG